MGQSSREPIRTLLLLNSLCVGGAEKQVVSLFNRLGSERHVVHLVCIKDEAGLMPEILAARQPQVLPHLGVRRGIEWAAVRQLAAHVDALDIDVLVCTNLYALLYGWLAKQLCRRQRPLRPLQLVEVFHSTGLVSRQDRIAMALYGRLLRVTDLLVCVCHGQARYWRDWGLRALQEVVIHNGIDTAAFQDHATTSDKLVWRQDHGLAAEAYLVGLCAVMRPEKAHADLLTALAQLQREGVKVSALLIGDGPERARLEEAIDALGLRENVHITGMLHDVRAAVSACDVMVLPSVETFSMAALEAMALGKPMVMTHAGGAPEQVTSGVNGLLYRVGDTEALAACLRQLADPVVRTAMGRRAASRVHQQFDVSHMVRGYAAALEALMAQRPVMAMPPVQPTLQAPGQQAEAR
jgi:glycosyltransferase involved in cell wall biosynthesis